jgi:hypothetical protein
MVIKGRVRVEVPCWSKEVFEEDCTPLTGTDSPSCKRWWLKTRPHRKDK